MFIKEACRANPLKRMALGLLAAILVFGGFYVVVLIIKASAHTVEGRKTDTPRPRENGAACLNEVMSTVTH